MGNRCAAAPSDARHIGGGTSIAAVRSSISPPKETAMTRIADVMTRNVRTVSPADNVVIAARLMAEMDVGSLPVCVDDQLVGIVTDRDIVLRAVASGRGVDSTTLDDVMTRDPLACTEDQTLEEVLAWMGDAQVRRLPVVDGHRHVVGLVSLGDLAVKHDQGEAGDALESISEPAEPATERVRTTDPNVLAAVRERDGPA
jgi:CBS domain-containing protein